MTTILGNSICSANTRRSDRWLLGFILWFDPRREHSSVPTADTAAAARRACQGWPRLRGHPQGPGLDWPEHGGMLIGSGLQVLTTLGKFKPALTRCLDTQAPHGNAGSNQFVGRLRCGRQCREIETLKQALGLIEAADQKKVTGF